MPDPVKTVIGFDFGSHWIGVAVGQTFTRQASPLIAVKAGDWRQIEKILKDWQPQRVIVGLPLNNEGGPQEMTASARRFSRRLEGRFGIKAELIDERLTTREAYQVAIASNKMKSKQEIDSLSAALITESWLRAYQD
ncbi:MAG: putative Holliday junction resolvase [Planctomycetota bacterium]|jgi:putative Holliday junction resolvase